MIERDCSVIYSYWPCNILHTSPCVSWLSTFIWIQLISVYYYHYYMLYCPTISYNINLKTREQCSNPEISSLYTGWLRTNFPQQIVLIPSVMNSITPCNNQPTLNQQGFWALLKWSQNYSNYIPINIPFKCHKITIKSMKQTPLFPSQNASVSSCKGCCTPNPWFPPWFRHCLSIASRTAAENTQPNWAR